MPFVLNDLNEQIFSSAVEKLVQERKMPYIDAILELCDVYQIEPEVAAKLVSRPIRENLHVEGIAKNILPKEAMLPFGTDDEELEP
jgi:hypothetical protein